MTKRLETAPEGEEEFDTLVSERMVLEEFDITSMTSSRWDGNEELRKLGWPPAIYIRGRKYRSRRMLEEFKRGLLKRAIETRGKKPDCFAKRAAARAEAVAAKKADKSKASSKRQAA